MRVLVLGGYGLIGLAIVKRLLADGHAVTGLGRSIAKGRSALAEADWIGADISKLTRPEDWHPLLHGIDAIVNASGALQTGLKDNVVAVQRDAIIALIAACETAGISTFVQISAPGAHIAADTDFYRTKAAADTALKASTLNWTILRPGLVLSPHAYGGTSLMRMLAAFPSVQPLVLGKAQIQTIGVGDVADATAHAIHPGLSGQDLDLVEPETHSLEELVLGVRTWLGFKPPRAVLRLPSWFGKLTALGADAAGWLGWRTALRSTSLSVLASDVRGDPAPWTQITGHPTQTFEQTLSALPATAQERVYARTLLVFPIVLILLAGFWVISGVIGLLQHDQAVAVLNGVLPGWLADAFVRLGSIMDILIGVALLFRSLTRLACFASILVALGYVCASAAMTPHLWADPLGPMVKVIPAIALALCVAAIAEER